jgi:hypothetical protein
VGGQVTFAVQLQPQASAPFSYTWLRNGSPIAARVSDARTDFLTLGNLQTSDAGLISVEVGNEFVPADTSPDVTLIILADSDADGLPDEFEAPRDFLSAGDPDDAALDHDGDGASNLEEYLAGTDPDDFGSRLRLEGISEESGVRLQFTGGAHRSYGLQFRNLTSENAWNTLQTFTPISDQGDVPRTIEIVDTAALLLPQRYYRVISPP